MINDVKYKSYLHIYTWLVNIKMVDMKTLISLYLFKLVLFLPAAVGNTCKIFSRVENVYVACDEDNLVIFDEAIPFHECFTLCDERQCTVVAMETSITSRWCCFLTLTNSTYYHGNNTLFYDKQIHIQKGE